MEKEVNVKKKTKVEETGTLGKFFKKLGLIALAIFLFIITLGIVLSVESDDKDLTDNQEYIITVSYGTTSYNYYCSAYVKKPENNSYILLDWEAKPFMEIMFNENIYFRAKLNPNFKKEYFLEKVEDQDILADN